MADGIIQMHNSDLSWKKQYVHTFVVMDA